MSYFHYGFEKAKSTFLRHIMNDDENIEYILVGLSYLFSSIKENPNHQTAPIVYYNLTLGLYLDNHYTMSYNLCNQVLKTLSDSKYHFYISFLKSELLFFNKDFRQSVEEFDRTIRLYGREKLTAQAFYRVAEIYYILNNYILADDVFKMAMLIDKNFIWDKPTLIWNIAESKFWIGENKKAEKYYHYLQKHHMNTRVGKFALMRMGDIAFELGQIKKAKYWYHYSSLMHGDQLSGKASKLMLTYINFLRKDNLRNLNSVDKKALSLYQKELEEIAVNPELSPFFQELAAYYYLITMLKTEELNLTHVNKMEDFIDKYPMSQFNTYFRPYFTDYYRKYIYTYYEQKAYSKMIYYYEQNFQSIYKNYNDPEMYLKLAEAYRFNKRYGLAWKSLQKTQNIDTKHLKPFYLKLAEISIYAKKTRQAIKYVKLAQQEEKKKIETKVTTSQFPTEVIERLLDTNNSTRFLNSLMDYLAVFKGQLIANFLPIIQNKYEKNNSWYGVLQTSKKILKIFKKNDKNKDVRRKAYLAQIRALKKLRKWKTADQTQTKFLEEYPSYEQKPSFMYSALKIADKAGKSSKYKKYLDQLYNIDKDGVYGRLANVYIKEMKEKAAKKINDSSQN